MSASSLFAGQEKKRSLYMKAKAFDQKFENGNDITEYLDLKGARRRRIVRPTAHRRCSPTLTSALLRIEGCTFS
jgi:hypothetical protein